jgi:predicted TIM-barrel fold metal-dependent hydrolase
MFLELLFPMQVSHPVPGGSIWDYPYVETHPLIADLLNHLGIEKLVWGTDLPNTERNCTYAQARNYLDRHCPLFSQNDKNLLFSENIRRVFKLG